MHNSFKEAINSTAWKLSGVLSSLHELFKDVPARRQDYKDVTGHELYPLQMCSHRWVENLSVCERVIAIRRSIIQYVKAVKAKKVCRPTTKSFAVVEAWADDPLASAKLAFVASVARIIEPFLKKYQSDEPLITFFYEDILQMIKTLMSLREENHPLRLQAVECILPTERKKT